MSERMEFNPEFGWSPAIPLPFYTWRWFRRRYTCIFCTEPRRFPSWPTARTTSTSTCDVLLHRRSDLGGPCCVVVEAQESTVRRGASHLCGHECRGGCDDMRRCDPCVQQKHDDCETIISYRVQGIPTSFCCCEFKVTPSA